MDEIAERVRHVRRLIHAALSRAGDPGREVTIVAVTKTMPASVVDAVAAAGIVDIGESRVQETAEKAPLVRAPVRWHLVGHLQRNKAKRAAGLFSVIHSVDSIPLLEALASAPRRPAIFLEVNIAADPRKHGIAPEHVRDLIRRALQIGTLDVLGLMAIPPAEADPRPVFRALRQLRDDLNRAGDGPPLRGLSMGMSGDYETAVEEGATHVRIGTALVGARTPPAR